MYSRKIYQYTAIRVESLHVCQIGGLTDETGIRRWGENAVAWKTWGLGSVTGPWRLWVFCAAEWIVSRRLYAEPCSQFLRHHWHRSCPNPVGRREAPGCIPTPPTPNLTGFWQISYIVMNIMQTFWFQDMCYRFRTQNCYIIPILKSPNL